MNNYDNFERLTCTTKIKDVKDGYYSFDDTVFYGEKGGQLADRGTINGQPVTDLKWDGDTLYHQVAGELHDPITMQVDARIRWINTAVQSAFHLLDGYYADKDTKIVEVNADPTNEWYIVNSKRVTPDQLANVEAWMNEIIHQDIHTSFTYVKGSEYPDPAYRKYPLVRLVHFGDVNTQPCGTCHVNHTGQLQSFVILGTTRVAAGTKIFITVNQVTNDRLKQDDAALKQVATVLSSKEDRVVVAAQDLVAKNKAAKKQVKALKKELAGLKVQNILAAGQVINEVQVDGAGRCPCWRPNCFGRLRPTSSWWPRWAARPALRSSHRPERPGTCWLSSRRSARSTVGARQRLSLAILSWQLPILSGWPRHF